MTVDEIIFLAGGCARDKSLATLTNKTKGETLFHLAAKAGLPDEVGMLMSNGTDPDAKDGRGRTAFKVAVGQGVRDVLVCPR